MNSKKIIFIVGPTAVGKTDIAILLAKKLKGEIVSCDSMQVYREVGVTTGKPTPAQLKKIPHHLINVVSVKKDFDVVAFNRRAVRAIKDIHRKNKIPIVTGGTGLYMQILLDGIFKTKDVTDPVLRRKLQLQEAKQKGSVWEKLKKTDPQAAAKIHPHDTKRAVRALEVYLLSKQKISELQQKRSGLWGKYDIYAFVLNRERQKLYNRINRRVEAMFREGAVKEIKNLRKFKLSRTAGQIIGLKEIGGYLAGEYDLKRAKDLLKQNTRRFAKRQLTWFRKDKRFQWITIENGVTANKVVTKIVKSIEGS